MCKPRYQDANEVYETRMKNKTIACLQNLIEINNKSINYANFKIKIKIFKKLKMEA